MEPSQTDPRRGIQVTMMLADFVDASKGSLTIVGGGPNVTGPGGLHAVALSFLVPWHLTNKKHQFRLELIDMDGDGVALHGNDEPFVLDGQIEAGRPPGASEGQAFPCFAGLNLGALGLPPHQQYEWRLLVNGEAREDWRLVFYTIPPIQGQQQMAA